MSMSTVNVRKGDTGFDFTFTITDADGKKVDLSGSTVKFRVGHPGDTPIIDGDCTDMSAEGTCVYTVQSGDLSEEGQFNAELEITTGSQIITVGGITVNINGELA